MFFKWIHRHSRNFATLLRKCSPATKYALPVLGIATTLVYPSLMHRASLCSALPEDSDEDIDELVSLRPKTPEYEMIDMSQFKDWETDNAFHGTLKGESMIENYEVYHNKEKDEVMCIITFGKSLNGHPGIVHGGITSLAFDNTFGWLFIALKTDPAFTANLNINYRRKVPANSHCVIRARVTKREGRKLFMSGTMEDAQGNILADGTSLFIVVRQ